MQEKQQHTLFVAHSNRNYALGLTIGLTENGYLIEQQSVAGIEALEFILRYQPKVAIIEAELPFLSAFDIIKTAKSKEVKTQFIVVLKTRELPMFEPLQFVKINEVFYCNMSVKTLLKVLSHLHKSKNWFWNLIEQRFKKFNNKMMKTMESLSNYEIAILLDLAATKKTKDINQDSNASVLLNRNLKEIALKLNLTHQQISLKEWCIKNNDILKAFSLRCTT
ncbi:ANTAR domain-containing protein [Lutibacter citreus]|uniref:response regulator transcription factor n=1 Tax=Lutibacter citreus TaxID=2138210 RepID=UPI000DBE066C|nr:response regulator transcription factor [Lutibacter citreus]